MVAAQPMGIRRLRPDLKGSSHQKKWMDSLKKHDLQKPSQADIKTPKGQLLQQLNL